MAKLQDVYLERDQVEKNLNLVGSSIRDLNKIVLDEMRDVEDRLRHNISISIGSLDPRLSDAKRIKLVNKLSGHLAASFHEGYKVEERLVPRRRDNLSESVDPDSILPFDISLGEFRDEYMRLAVIMKAMKGFRSLFKASKTVSSDVYLYWHNQGPLIKTVRDDIVGTAGDSIFCLSAEVASHLEQYEPNKQRLQDIAGRVAETSDYVCALIDPTISALRRRVGSEGERLDELLGEEEVPLVKLLTIMDRLYAFGRVQQGTQRIMKSGVALEHRSIMAAYSSTRTGSIYQELRMRSEQKGLTGEAVRNAALQGFQHKTENLYSYCRELMTHLQVALGHPGARPYLLQKAQPEPGKPARRTHNISEDGTFMYGLIGAMWHMHYLYLNKACREISVLPTEDNDEHAAQLRRTIDRHQMPVLYGKSPKKQKRR